MAFHKQQLQFKYCSEARSKVTGKQLQCMCPEKFFPYKKVVDGGEVVVHRKKIFWKNVLNIKGP
jgi:hypothetical protein